MTEKDPFYMREHEQPQQAQETGVPPAADNNVQSISKDVLLVRTAKGSHYDGMGGGLGGLLEYVLLQQLGLASTLMIFIKMNYCKVPLKMYTFFGCTLF